MTKCEVRSAKHEKRLSRVAAARQSAADFAFSLRPSRLGGSSSARPASTGMATAPIQISSFGFPSDFGFRISDFLGGLP